MESKALISLRRTMGNLRCVANVLPNYQETTANTMKGFALEIERVLPELDATWRKAEGVDVEKAKQLIRDWLKHDQADSTALAIIAALEEWSN